MARRLIVAVAFVLLAAACGGSEENSPDIGAPTTLGDALSGSPTTADGLNSNGSAPTTNRPRPGTGNRPAETGRPPASTASTKAAIDDAAAGPVGHFAGVVLAPGIASSLVLDVRFGGGASPRSEAVEAMADALRAHSGKPVTLSGPSALSGVSGGTHSSAEIRRLADAQGTPNRDGVAVLHVLYLAGEYENEGVLGVAVRGDTVALFPDSIESATSPFVSGARLERAVATHELGHLLGLVDLYLNRNRDDVDHPGHSRNRGSVMYWAVETSLVGQVFGGPPPVDFDAEDVADMRAIRSGAASAY